MSDIIQSKDMPAPDQLVRYEDGTIAPAMFHYSTEGCDPNAIAQEAGFEIGYTSLENDENGEDAWDAYERITEAAPDAPAIEEVFDMWTPTPPDGGWKLVGKHDTEDGPMAVFVRPITRQ